MYKYIELNHSLCLIHVLYIYQITREELWWANFGPTVWDRKRGLYKDDKTLGSNIATVPSDFFFFGFHIVNECFVWLGIILIFNPSFYFKWHQLTYLLTNEWLMFPLFYVTQFNFFFLYFKYTLIIYCLTEIDVLTYCRQKTI